LLDDDVFVMILAGILVAVLVELVAAANEDEEVVEFI
jgi:hypothetical protein